MQTSKSFIRTLFVVAFAPLALWLAGCAAPAHRSTAYQKSDAVAHSTRVAAREVQIELNDLDAVMATLGHLVNDTATDLRPRFAAYNQAVDRLYRSIERVELAITRMQKKNAAYMEEWDRHAVAMNYGITREHRDARKKAIQNETRSISRRYVETRETLLPLLAYLEDLRKMLSTDLTVGGVEGIKNLADNAIENGRKVQTALGQFSDQLTDASRQMSSFDWTRQTATAQFRESEGQSKRMVMTKWIRTTVFRMDR